MQEEGGKGLNMNVRPCPIVQGRANGIRVALAAGEERRSWR